MGKNPGKIFILVTGIITLIVFVSLFCFFFFRSFEMKGERSAEGELEQVTHFSLKQFAQDKTSFTIQGETAEVFSTGGTSISTPELSLNTATENIEIKTGKEGKGEINIIPDKKKVQTIVITGNVRIIYKDIKTEAVTMEGRCSKLTYNDKEKVLIMEGSPVVIRGRSHFKSDIIYYRLDRNILELKGNVNAQIYSEKETSD